MNANLPSVCLNTVTPTPPTTEKLVKSAVPWRQMNLFHKEPVRNSRMESQGAVATQAHTTAGQESTRPSVDTEAQATKTCKPYSMNLALQNHSNSKARVLRLPTSRMNSERYPKAKRRDDNRNGSVLNRFDPNNRKGRIHNSSPKNSNFRSDLKDVYTPGSMDKKHVRFEQDSRQI